MLHKNILEMAELFGKWVEDVGFSENGGDFGMYDVVL